MGPEFAVLVEDIGKRIHDIAGHPAYNSIQGTGTPFATCDAAICADLRTVIIAIHANAKEEVPA